MRVREREQEITCSVGMHRHGHSSAGAGGESVSVMCTDCGGPLWALRDEKLRRYRCRIGHAFTAESLLAGQSEALEYALWAAVRTMEDRVRILMTLAHGRREYGQSKLADIYETRAKELKTQAQQIRQMLLEAGNP